MWTFIFYWFKFAITQSNKQDRQSENELKTQKEKLKEWLGAAR